jgi:hypothetical protein
MRSVWDGQRKYDPAHDDVVVTGDSEVIPITVALATDFEAAFRHALESFANDTDAECPNGAHKECWPSAREFRHIRFRAGQHQGLAAANHLDRIPDRDVRLFAQIELWAAIAGLPGLGGPTTQYRGNRRSSLRPNSTGYSARSCPVSAAQNASGARVQRSSGPASAVVPGIRSTLADYARDVALDGKSPDASSVEQCLRTWNGTWTIDLASAPTLFK